MAKQRKRHRLVDAYAFPGFRPRAFVQGMFGDAWARIVTLDRRGKNGLWGVRDSAPELLRPGAPTSAGSAVRSVSDLAGSGNPPSRLPYVPCGEAGAAGVSARARTIHAPLCPLRRSALCQRDDQGRGQGTAAGVGCGQGARQAIHARATRARRQAEPSDHRDRRDLGAQGARLSHRGQRFGAAATDLVRWEGPQGGEHGRVLCVSRAKKAKRSAWR